MEMCWLNARVPTDAQARARTHAVTHTHTQGNVLTPNDIKHKGRKVS
jgi:hypothetical protein